MRTGIIPPIIQTFKEESVILSRTQALVLIAISSMMAVAQQAEPVLKQVTVPHPYYYREMYLPQLTTGPGSMSWSPDSQSLIYSMGGTLWRQRLNSQEAQQITSGSGYDYQPDCSPDGKWIIYASYWKDAIELWVLDVSSRQAHQLTTGGAVNVDPRFSPDGKRVVFVSTSFNGRFHIFVGDFADGRLTNVQRLTGENRTTLKRFYYSPIDHEISPAWSPDGSEIVYVSNHNHIYGTGGFWRMKAEPGEQAREIHYEETAWRARPQFSPDGKRIVYASYLGRQWHQLWAIPSEGGDAFPLSYGDFDNTYPRWSPDGERIAFISNRGGNTSLWFQDVLGGLQTEVVATTRHFLKPVGTLAIKVVDSTGHPTAARIFVTGEDGRAYAPNDAWMHAEDNFVRAERPFEPHYFHTTGTAELTVPVGRVNIEIMKGFEYRIVTQSAQITQNQRSSLAIKLQALNIPQKSSWASADLHVHMNYGGIYRNTPENLVRVAAAEDLPIVENLIVNKEQRIPDIAYFSTKADPASTANNILLHAQEFHTSYWGHLGLLNLTRNYLIPDYASYGNTAAASLFPANADVADLAHEQQGLVGYVHPFDFVPDPIGDSSLTHHEPLDVALELPVDVALGKVDYIEVLGFSDHKSTADVWYRLLNCGFHLPTGAGSDTMANFASLRGPVGLTRVYAKVPKGPLDMRSWLESLKQGRTFATNAPLLGLSLEGKEPGDELPLPAGKNNVKLSAWMRSIVPIDHLQVICNGDIVRDLPIEPDHETADVQDTIELSRSGWCVLRAFSDKAEHPILDIYPYGTTSPIYITVAGSKPDAKKDAAFFIAWIDRLTEYASANKDWDTDAEKTQTLGLLGRARKIYEKLEQ
ncbi:MAG TPA: CehA/McbA family metallohydrolase [Terriglobales bacterium]|jgi:Tol biopolymer transport system component